MRQSIRSPNFSAFILCFHLPSAAAASRPITKPKRCRMFAVPLYHGDLPTARSRVAEDGADDEGGEVEAGIICVREFMAAAKVKSCT